MVVRRQRKNKRTDSPDKGPLLLALEIELGGNGDIDKPQVMSPSTTLV